MRYPRISSYRVPVTVYCQKVTISNCSWVTPTVLTWLPQKASRSPSKAIPYPYRVSINNWSAKPPPIFASCVLPNLIRPRVFATKVRPSAARPERQVSNVNCQYQRQRQKRCPSSPSYARTQTDQRYRCTPTLGSQPF